MAKGSADFVGIVGADCHYLRRIGACHGLYRASRVLDSSIPLDQYNYP